MGSAPAASSPVREGLVAVAALSGHTEKRMDDLPDIFLRHLQRRLGDVASQLTRVRFSSFQLQGTWVPAINAYRCHEGFVICVELAGVDRAHLDLRVEPRRVLIRGRRHSPEPDDRAGAAVQILALEIDDGPFEREIALPVDIEPDEVQAEQRNGLLWIYLPSPSTE